MIKAIRTKAPTWLKIWVLLSFVALVACDTAAPTTTPVNLAPIILDVGFPVEVNPGDVVRITAIATDPDGDDSLLTYKWSVFSGGGTFEPEESVTIPTTTYIASEEIRIHQFKIVVVDVQGLTDTEIFSVRVVEVKGRPQDQQPGS